MISKISPSMMCADITKIKETIESFEKNKIDYLHIDIMDGLFVPNFMLGTDYIKRLRKITTIPMDIHLMIDKPEDKLDWFEIKENDIVSVHAESTVHLQKALKGIRDKGAKAFVALNPATPINTLEYVTDDMDGVLVMTVNPGFAGQKMIPATLNKITDIRNYLNSNKLSMAEIEVDGNVSYENAVKMKNAGADIFVVGSSSIFNSSETLDEGILHLRNLI